MRRAMLTTVLALGLPARRSPRRRNADSRAAAGFAQPGGQTFVMEYLDAGWACCGDAPVEP